MNDTLMTSGRIPTDEDIQINGAAFKKGSECSSMGIVDRKECVAQPKATVANREN